MSKRSKRFVACVMLVMHLGACMTWRPATIGPRQLIEEQEPPVVRVWHEARATEVVAPQLDGAELVSGGEEPTRIQLSAITRIETKEIHLGRSLLLAWLFGSLMFAVYCASDSECWDSYSY